MENKIQKLNKISAMTFFAILFVIFVLLFVGKISNSIFGKGYTIDINWTQLYPFSDDDLVTITQDNNNQSQSKLSEIFNLYYKIMAKFEMLGESWGKVIPKYSDIVKYGKFFDACISDITTDGTYIKLNNGYWTSVSSKEDESSINNKSNAIKDISEFVEMQNIPFLYVQAPHKICKYDKELPIGVEDYNNENMDSLLEALNNENIDYIDMREAVHKENVNHYSLYYKTDHHWNIDAGFWACSVIEEAVEDNYGIVFNTEYNDISLYNSTIYENAMFGSSGQAVTHFLEKSEDFSILFPKFETSFKLVIPDKGIDEIGSFSDLFVDYDGLNTQIAKGGGYAYETLLYGNRPLVQITNYNNEKAPKVFMIRDSFSVAVAPYMALGCSELDLIDIRPTNGNFTGSVRTYIKEMQPDIVIMLVSSPSTAYR
jgi:hypothetical protein